MGRSFNQIIVPCGTLLLLLATGLAQTWVEDSFEDFSDGQLEAAGQNLYVTSSGTIKNIHRFDLNKDGFLDLVFNSSHDLLMVPPATCYELAEGRGSGKVHDLPVFGSSCATVADLNRDGWVDAIICPNNDWVTSRRYLSILWGDENGWSARRMSKLLTIAPSAVEVADLDVDGWPEIIVLNGTRWAPEDGPEAVLRIYWGSVEAYRQERYLEVVLANLQDLKVEDLDGDSRPELLLLQEAVPLSFGPTPSPALAEITNASKGRVASRVLIYWNDGIDPSRELPDPQDVPLTSAGSSRLEVADYNGDRRLDLIVNGGPRELIGQDPTTGAKRYRYSGLVLVAATDGPRKWAQPEIISTSPSSTFAVADLNQDGWAEIVLADRSAEQDSIRILWGGSETRLGTNRSKKLPIGYASALAIGDLDGDKNLDLVVGVGQARETYEANSRIFYGDGNGGFQLADLQIIPTASVNDVVIAQGNGKHGNRVIFSNNMAGRIHEDVPVDVYWGDQMGFRPGRRSQYRILSGHASSAADLDDNGYVDLILASIVHFYDANVEDPSNLKRGFNILWGDRDGLQDDRRTVVQEYAMTATNVADLDRDGYLDLIGSCNLPGLNGESHRIVIWPGGPAGFDPERRQVLRCQGVDGPNVVADFNQDGFLDIAVTRGLVHRVSVFWGSQQGFSDERESSWPLMAADDINTADLDGDGWLDLIVTSYRIPGTLHFDFGTHIFWGGPKGFGPTRSQRLPGYAACGINVADYDRDGFLDLFVPNYHYGNTRESVASYLFWGSADGFSELDRTDLMVDSGHAALSADFDRDGLIDLAVSCHARNGIHLTNSRVYYNDGERFRQPRFVELPTVGSHYMYRADVGNIYDRSYLQHYVSSIFQWNDLHRKVTLRVESETPGDTRLTFETRWASGEDDLVRAPWVELKPLDLGSSQYFGPIDFHARFLQYRVLFFSDNGDRYPTLDRVEVILSD